MVKETNCGCSRGRDVCINPICGQPDVLSVYAPVVYDEIGINVCRPIQIPADVIAANPTATCVQLEVVDFVFTEATDTTPGTTIAFSNRANCVSITLTNILITYRVKLFDASGNYLTSTVITANYLPGGADSTEFEFFDSETNPESVIVEMYAPYGVGYLEPGVSPYINVVGLTMGSNMVVNGINASVIAKGMNFNPVTGILSAGISLVLRTVYYEVYKFANEGKPVTPKAQFNGAQNNVCLEFVEGGLLSREIKPLELEYPNCEQRYKEAERSRCDVNSGIRQITNCCDTEQMTECDNDCDDCDDED